MKNLQETATSYSKDMNGDYFDELFPNTDETIGEIGVKDFISGYKYAEKSLVNYWKTRCELAEKCLEESPCDPDITNEQIFAHSNYNAFLSNNKTPE